MAISTSPLSCASPRSLSEAFSVFLAARSDDSGVQRLQFISSPPNASVDDIVQALTHLLNAGVIMYLQYTIFMWKTGARGACPS